MAYSPYSFGYSYTPQVPQIPNPMPQSGQAYYGNSQIVQVAGKPSVDMIRLEPYKGLLALDTTAPLLWVCTADGVGHVTATAFDISPHKEAAESPTGSQILEQRITSLEETIKELGEKINGTYQSGDPSSTPKHGLPAQNTGTISKRSEGPDVVVADNVYQQPAAQTLS